MSCDRCQQLEQLLHEAEANLAVLGEELAGVQVQARRSGRAEQLALRKLREAQEADPKSEQVREVLNHWQAHHPKAKTPMTGKRADMVRKGLRLGFDVDQLKLALDGLRAFPFVGAGGRKADGVKSERYDDVDHALRDESTIERFIGYATDNPPHSASQPKPAPPQRAQNEAVDASVTLNVLLTRLKGVRPAGLNQWEACCPAHEDRNASLSIGLGSKGVVAHCHAACTAQEIADAVGVPLTQWFDSERTDGHKPRPVPVPDVLPSDQTIEAWRDRLQSHGRMLDRLLELRGWTAQALLDLEVGWDGKRLTLPVRGPAGDLVTVARYLPGGKPKMLGLKHRDRGLFPAPESFREGRVWVCEGEPDAITLASLGLPGVGIPGSNGWRPAWAERFKGRDVVLVPDCDEPGRKLAHAVTASLIPQVASVRVLDLDEGRSDGFDLSDAIRDGLTVEVLTLMAEAVGAVKELRAA